MSNLCNSKPKQNNDVPSANPQPNFDHSRLCTNSTCWIQSYFVVNKANHILLSTKQLRLSVDNPHETHHCGDVFSSAYHQVIEYSWAFSGAFSVNTNLLVKTQDGRRGCKMWWDGARTGILTKLRDVACLGFPAYFTANTMLPIYLGFNSTIVNC